MLVVYARVFLLKLSDRLYSGVERRSSACGTAVRVAQVRVQIQRTAEVQSTTVHGTVTGW